MAKTALIALFLLLFLGFAHSLSEFSYLFADNSPASVYALAIYGKKCPSQVYGFTPMKRSLIPSSAAGVLTDFDLAIRASEAAAKIDRYVPHAAYLVAPSTALSLICHQIAISAINYASSAVRGMLSALDAKFSELDSLQGDEEIFSNGLAIEKARTEAELAAGEPKSPFSSALLSPAGNLSSLWRSFPESTENFAVISQLIGRKGALEEASIFTRRISLSIDLLEAIHLNISREYAVALFNAEEDISRLRQDGLGGIGRDPIQMVGRDALSEQSGISFFDEIRSLESLLKKAKSLHSDSERAYAAKRRGFLAYSFNQKSQSLSICEEISVRAGLLGERSQILDSGLREMLSSLREKARLETESRRDQPLSHTFLKKRLAELEDDHSRLPFSSPLGERINAQANFIGKFSDFLSLATASDIAAYGLADLRGALQRTEALMGRAKTDGIAVFVEESQIAALKPSIASLDPSTDLQILDTLGKSLSEVEKSAIRKAQEKFVYLEEKYWALEKHSKFLSLQDRIRLEDFSRLFDAGKLDVERNLGELSSLEQFVLKKTEEFEVKKPAIVAEHLESAMLITELSDPTPIGNPAIFTSFIFLENSLGIDASNILVRLPLPPESTLLNASPGVSLEKKEGQLFLLISKPQKKYFATLQFELAANIPLLDKTEFEKINSHEIGLKRGIKFRTLRHSRPVIELDAYSDEYSLEYAGIHSESLEGNILHIEADALPGDHSLEVVFRIPNPFGLNVREVARDESSLTMEFEYSNDAIGIPGAGFEYDGASACEISKVLVLQSDFSFTDHSRGNYLSFSLKAGEWAKGQMKKLSLRLICANRISGLLGEAVANANISGSLRDFLALEKSKQSLSEGDYAAALKFLDEAAIDRQTSRPGLEEKIHALEKAAAFMAEHNYEIELGNSLSNQLQAARNHLQLGRFAEAEKELNSAQKAIREALEAKLAHAKGQCKSGCGSEELKLLESMSVAMLLLDYADAISFAFDFEALSGARESELAKSIGAKQAAFVPYAQILEESQSLFSDFSLFFNANPESQSALRANAFYKSGFAAKTALEKLLRELSSINNALEIGETGKYSAPLISEKINSAAAAIDSLEESLAGIRDMAEKRYAEAERRAVQFGGEAERGFLMKAKEESEMGHHFLAYFLATNLNDGLARPVRAENKPELIHYAFPVAAIFLGLAYYLIFYKKETCVSLAKSQNQASPQSDLPNVLEQG